MSFITTEDEKRALGLDYDERNTSGGRAESKREFARNLIRKIKLKKAEDTNYG